MEIYGSDIRGGSSMKMGPWTGGSFLLRLVDKVRWSSWLALFIGFYVLEVSGSIRFDSVQFWYRREFVVLHVRGIHQVGRSSFYQMRDQEGRFFGKICERTESATNQDSWGSETLKHIRGAVKHHTHRKCAHHMKWHDGNCQCYHPFGSPSRPVTSRFHDK
jgi:hypothetical protein